MPRLKVGDDELDIEELENAEYSEDDQFEDYDGPVPPKRTLLRGFVKLAYWTLDSSDERMIKSLWIAAENTGDKAKYNGLPIWDNTSLKASTKFRWAPLIRAWGITLTDLKKKLYCKPEDEDHPTRGAVIEKIGPWAPGEESDSAWCMVLTDIDNYGGEKSASVGKWMPWVDEEEDDEDADEVADEVEEDQDDEPEDDEEVDDADEAEEDEDQEEDDEEDEEAAPPARTGRGGRAPARTAAKAATRSTATRGTKPATTTRAARPAAGKATATRGAKPAAAGRRGAGAKGSNQPPPF